MERKWLIIIWVIGVTCNLAAQNIPVSLSYVRLYDYLDELITDGVITAQTTVRPYTRTQVASMLLEAENADSLLNARQKADLVFYLMSLL